jgi:hypothetical protein
MTTGQGAQADLNRIDAFMESVAKGLYPNFVEFLRYDGNGCIPENMDVNSDDDDVKFLEEIIDLTREGRKIFGFGNSDVLIKKKKNFFQRIIL